MLKSRDRQLSPPLSSVPNLTTLPAVSLWEEWKADFQTVLHRDPLINHTLEILFTSPSFHGLMLHRIAHRLYRWQVPLLPRLISQVNRFLTGIEIHPGAHIGRGVFIVHGMGVVIGETAIVGEETMIYQEVTLGGTGKEMGKRHPTLGKSVVVEAGAKVLGNIHIGDRVRIGASSIVLRDVPDNSVVTGVPGRVIYRGKALEPLPSDEMLPDLEAQVIQILFERLKGLESQISDLKATVQPPRLPDVPLMEDGAIAQSNQLIEEFLDGAGI